MQNLELSDGEAAVFVRELPDITWKDRYPLSSRIRVLGEILGMLRRRAWWRPGFHRVLSHGGFDCVSCSPYRVPIARLAAAQAALSGEARSGTA
jgi:hypothetical protein